MGSSRDLHVILEAMRYVEEREKRACFLIIGGEGPLQEEYVKLINTLRLKTVRITGRIAHHRVPQYLAACDMGLIFMEENRVNKMRVSLKLIEYLSMDLPVVGHITGESRDVFGQYCFLCSPSARALGEKILEGMENQHRRESPRDFIVQHYDWKTIEHSVSELLENSVK
jgi:glycosyltransferase involved in cell wall biosynthesis